MREHFHSGSSRRCWAAIFLLAISFAFGCSKSDQTTSRDVQPTPLLAATIPAPVAIPAEPPHRQTASERLVEIDRLLAMPLTGTPAQADERVLLRAERAALISSGQVPYQSISQASGQLSPAAVGQYLADSDSLGHAPATADPQPSQIVIANNSQATSLPFLEQMTPTERDHYFEDLWLQNGSFVDVNHNGFGFGRFGLNRRGNNRWPPGRVRMAGEPSHRPR